MESFIQQLMLFQQQQQQQPVSRLVAPTHWAPPFLNSFISLPLLQQLGVYILPAAPTPISYKLATPPTPTGFPPRQTALSPPILQPTPTTSAS
ncbi:hypothetical protein A1F94_013391 [Pyrenophora tritici-repentis]|nr:hypothetical protein A1F94_013391 [Pyrenophora tritici-repentis]